MNIENGTGTYSLVQKETSAHKGQATGNGSVVFGGFRGDKPNDTPNPIPADDATVSNISSDNYNDTISKVAGIQSAVFGAGNRAYGDWNFIAGKDSKTTSRGSFAFGGKNYVGDSSNPNKYLWSMAVGGLNIISSDYSFAAGIRNHLSTSYSIGLGYDNTLRGNSTKAIGNSNLIGDSGGYSIAVGNGLLINLPLQIALGNYNTPGDANTLLVLGNGAADNARSNAFEVTKTGVARAYGTISGDNDLTPKSYVDVRVSANPAESGSTDLTKLKVGDTIYNIPSGKSGGVYLHRLYLGSIGTCVYFKTSFSTPITPQNATTLFGFLLYDNWMVLAYAESDIQYVDYIPCLYKFPDNDAVIRWNNNTTENNWTDTVIEL